MSALSIELNGATVRALLWLTAVALLIGGALTQVRPSADSIAGKVELIDRSEQHLFVTVREDGRVALNGLEIKETVRRTQVADELRFSLLAAAPADLDTLLITLSLPAPLLFDDAVTFFAIHGGTVSETLVSRDRQTVTAKVTDLEAGATVSVAASMTHGALPLGLPARLQSLTSAVPPLTWWTVGIAIPLFTYLIFRFWFWSRQRLEPVGGLIDHPPSALSPAAAALLVGGRSSPSLIAATLLNLAIKGDVQLVRTATGYRVARRRTVTGLSRLEELLIAELRLQLGPITHEEQVTEAAHQHLFSRQMTEAFETVYHELAVRGLFISSRRAAVTARFTSFWLILVSVGLAGLAGTTIVDGWLMAPVFGGLFLAGWLVLIVSPELPRLTSIGLVERSRWLAFRDYLTAKQKIQSSSGELLFERYLPYAVAFGLTKEWLARFDRHRLALPEWYFNEESSGSTEEFLLDITVIAQNIGQTLGAVALPTV